MSAPPKAAATPLHGPVAAGVGVQIVDLPSPEPKAVTVNAGPPAPVAVAPKGAVPPHPVAWSTLAKLACLLLGLIVVVIGMFVGLRALPRGELSKAVTLPSAVSSRSASPSPSPSPLASMPVPPGHTPFSFGTTAVSVSTAAPKAFFARIPDACAAKAGCSISLQFLASEGAPILNMSVAGVPVALDAAGGRRLSSLDTAGGRRLGLAAFSAAVDDRLVRACRASLSAFGACGVSIFVAPRTKSGPRVTGTLKVILRSAPPVPSPAACPDGFVLGDPSKRTCCPAALPTYSKISKTCFNVTAPACSMPGVYAMGLQLLAAGSRARELRGGGYEAASVWLPRAEVGEEEEDAERARDL